MSGFSVLFIIVCPPPFYRQERCSSPYNPFQNPNPPPVFSKSLIRPCFLLVCHNTGPFCQKQIRWKTFRLRTFLFYEDEANHLQLPMLPWKWLNYNRTQPSLLWGYRGHHRNQEYWWCYVTLEIKHCLFLSLHVQPGWLHSGGFPKQIFGKGAIPIRVAGWLARFRSCWTRQAS